MGRAPIEPSLVVPLNDIHDFSSFDSGDASLDRWLKDRARRNDDLWASRTFIIHRANVVVGYYAFSTGEITRMAVPGSMRQNMPDPLPTMLLGRLAIDRSMQGRGLGGSMLVDALTRMANIGSVARARLGVVAAISDDAQSFYRRFGFVETVTDPVRLVLDLRNLRVER